MIDKIRAEVTTKEFKATIKKFQRAPNKTLAGSREYIKRHFDNCSVLCIMRVDLYLNRNNYFAGELENEPVSSKESIEFIDAFIDGMKKRRFQVVCLITTLVTSLKESMALNVNITSM